MSSLALVELPERTGVALVGAGSTGLALVCALAARGIEFKVMGAMTLSELSTRLNPAPSSRVATEPCIVGAVAGGGPR